MPVTYIIAAQVPYVSIYAVYIRPRLTFNKTRILHAVPIERFTCYVFYYKRKGDPSSLGKGMPKGSNFNP
jgi:hypothetical protein